MPHLEINQEAFPGDLDVANPNKSFKPEDGLWDIFVKSIRPESIKLFPERRY